MEYTFYIQEFEQFTCACPEKQRMPWYFSPYWTCIFYHSGFLSNWRLSWKTGLPKNFSLYGIYFLHSDVLNNLRLPWKTEGALNSLYLMYFFYYSGFLSNLRLPWKTELPWNFLLHWNTFYYSGFLRNCGCPENRVCPEIFQARGSGRPPDPPPRTPMNVGYPTWPSEELCAMLGQRVRDPLSLLHPSPSGDWLR